MRRSSIHTGLPPSHKRRGGPPAAGTTNNAPPFAYATRDASGDHDGGVSSQYGMRARSVVKRRGAAPGSSAQMSDVSRSRMNATEPLPGESARARGRPG